MGFMEKKLKYKRIIIKLSGEAIGGTEQVVEKDGRIKTISKFGVDFDLALRVCKNIGDCYNHGCEIAVVIGGGNIWRGKNSGGKMHGSNADNMGMLATTINSVAIHDCFETLGVPSVIMTATPMPKIGDLFVAEKAVEHMKEKKIVIICGGTGNPFFTTDTAVMLRAAELGVDLAILGKSVDYVYTSDPAEDKNAKAIKKASYDYLIENQLNVIDVAASSIAKNNNIPAELFVLGEGDSIKDVVIGNEIKSTYISNDKEIIFLD